jgi:nitrite reductase/ring-hydroxylating ferredoxin subunit
VSASGYLGGHLAYRQGANVLHEQEEPDFAEATAEAVGTEWHTLGLVDGLQHDRLVAIESDGVKLMALRHGLKIRVLAGTCSYCDDDLTAGALEQGDGSSSVECAQDGSVFDLATGAVLRGPASAPLPLFETLIDAGMVEIRRAAPTA